MDAWLIVAAIAYVVIGGLLGFAYWRALDKAAGARLIAIAVGIAWPLVIVFWILAIAYTFILSLGRVE